MDQMKGGSRPLINESLRLRLLPHLALVDGELGKEVNGSTEGRAERPRERERERETAVQCSAVDGLHEGEVNTQQLRGFHYR